MIDETALVNDRGPLPGGRRSGEWAGAHRAKEKNAQAVSVSA